MGEYKTSISMKQPIIKNLNLISFSIVLYVVLYIYQSKSLKIDSEASHPICNLLNLFAERLRFKIKKV